MRRILALCAAMLAAPLCTQHLSIVAQQPTAAQPPTPAQPSTSANPSASLALQVADALSARVAGAEVTLYYSGSSRPAALLVTTGEGVAEFHGLPRGDYRIHVLAPGFSPQDLGITVAAADNSAMVTLQVANAAQTVSVTAATVPATAEESGADVTVINSAVLTDLEPAETGDVLRFAPGAVIGDDGRLGGLTSLFVRGGDSDYNKVIVDGVPVAEPGGAYDFGSLSTVQADRIEFLRGTESTLYGSDAMTSVVQVFSRTGSTETPLLSLGADGGNFSSAHGYGSLSGVYRKLDYNFFGEQFNTGGQGMNDAFSNSTEGANLGYAATPKVQLRLRMRHNVSYVGDQGEWNFSDGGPLPAGDYNLPPDTTAFSRQNNFLGSFDVGITAGTRWLIHLTGFEFSNHRLDEQDPPLNPARVDPFGFPIDYVDYNANGNPIPSRTIADYNRSGFDLQAQYLARHSARLIFGTEFEDENGFFGDTNSCASGAIPGCIPINHGLRRNFDAYIEELVPWKRFTLQLGERFVHNENFGNYGVPRVAGSYLVLRGSSILSGTRLRGSYAEGIKEPNFEDTFGEPSFAVIGNPSLKPEQNRAFEAGLNQALVGGKYSLDATYFNNLFHNQIEGEFILPPAAVCPPADTAGCFEFINLNRSFAQGAEVTLQGHPLRNLQLQAAYVFTSTQILSAPAATDPIDMAGRPLLRRPKHSGNAQATYTRKKFGATLAGTFIGMRPDSDFDVLPTPLTHDAGYARVDLGGWYAIERHVTAYFAAGNIFNKTYEDSLGYPGLKFNFRAGLRFTVGGE